jgi:hypothetical protein
MRPLFHRWQSVLLLSGSSFNVHTHFHRLSPSRGAQHKHRSFCSDITKLASSSLNKVLDLDDSNVDTAGTSTGSMNTTAMTTPSTTSSSLWIPYDAALQAQAQQQLRVWPLDEYNAVLLNEVHPRGYTVSTNTNDGSSSSSSNNDFVYDLIALGAGAGGLVASKQSARRGAKSAMISEHLAGGDCLNVGTWIVFLSIRVFKSVIGW